MYKRFQLFVLCYILFGYFLYYFILHYSMFVLKKIILPAYFIFLVFYLVFRIVVPQEPGYIYDLYVYFYTVLFVGVVLH